MRRLNENDLNEEGKKIVFKAYYLSILAAHQSIVAVTVSGELWRKQLGFSPEFRSFKEPVFLKSAFTFSPKPASTVYGSLAKIDLFCPVWKSDSNIPETSVIRIRNILFYAASSLHWGRLMSHQATLCCWCVSYVILKPKNMDHKKSSSRCLYKYAQVPALEFEKVSSLSHTTVVVNLQKNFNVYIRVPFYTIHCCCWLSSSVMSREASKCSSSWAP